MIDFREKPGSPEYILHYGIKGMRWGVRKEDATSGQSRSTSAQKLDEKNERRAKAKKVAIGVGILVAAAGAAYVTKNLSDNHNLKMKEIRHQAAINAKKAAHAKANAESIMQEPTRPILASRGKNIGYHILDSGGVQNPVGLLDALGLTTSGSNELAPGEMRKMAGKIAAVLPDPEGRKDHAGRPLNHSIVIPRSMASDINSMDDVLQKVWPMLKPTYEEMYQRSLKPQWEQ